MSFTPYALPTDLADRDGRALTARPLTTANVPTVMALEARAHSHPWRRSAYEDCLRGAHACWLLCEGEAIAGFVVVSWGGDEGELLNIAVDPARQGRGVGRALLKLALDQLRHFAADVFLEVRAGNERAIDLYRRAGFVEAGRRPAYYPAGSGREDALIFVCSLGRGVG